MALQYSPKIVQDSLVMCLDASQNKSYPTDLPVKNGLALWLDAADDTTFSYSSGTSVSQWRDKSGNNRHFFQATAGNQPSRSAVINSRKAIQFTAASNQYLRYNSTIINNTTGGSVFVVWRTAGETNAYSSILDNYHCGNSALNAGFQIERNVTNNQYYWGFMTTGCANGGTMPATSYSNDTTNCIWITKDSTTITGGLNGTSVNPDASPSATWVEDTKGWTIGAWGSGTETFGRFFNGQQCEVIIFNRGLSATERKQVNTYLGQKWGISNTDRSIVDLAGNNNNGLLGNGTVANMPDYDFYNKGTFSFTQTLNDTILTSLPITSTPALSNFTYEVWTKLNKFPTAVSPANAYGNTYRVGFLFGASYYQGAGLLWYGYAAGDAFSIYAFIRGNDAYRSTTGYPFALNQYYHCVMVNNYGANKLQLYINGILYNEVDAATQEYNSSLASDAGNIGISKAQVDGGGTANYSHYDGIVAVARIYNKALSAVEVAQNYQAQKSKFANTIVQSGLVLNLDAGNIYSYGGAGTTFYDVSPTALSWTINNATYNSSDPKYFSYNGSNSWLESSTSAVYDSQTITMECWFYTSVVVQNGFLFEKGAVNSQYSMFLNQGDVFYFRTIGGTINNQDLTFTSSTYLTANVWNHVICTYNGSIKIIYVNGIQVASVNASGTLNTGQTNQYIGKYGNAGNNYPFNGRIGESRVYNIALSAAQVLQNYNATKGKFGL